MNHCQHCQAALMPNGSLYEQLHISQGEMLDWPTRYKIAFGAAKGMSYLHHGCSPPIIHRDVKSYNILLDSELEAHITDFGLARIVEKLGQINVMLGLLEHMDILPQVRIYPTPGKLWKCGFLAAQMNELERKQLPLCLPISRGIPVLLDMLPLLYALAHVHLMTINVA